MDKAVFKNFEPKKFVSKELNEIDILLLKEVFDKYD